MSEKSIHILIANLEDGHFYDFTKSMESQKELLMELTM